MSIYQLFVISIHSSFLGKKHTYPDLTPSWLLSGLGLDTLRQQVQGSWSEARLQACLPWLRRFLCSRPRRRVHQETTMRAWLEQRARVHSDTQRQVA